MDGRRYSHGSLLFKVYLDGLRWRADEWFARDAGAARLYGLAPSEGGRLVLCFTGRPVRWTRFSASSGRAGGRRSGCRARARAGKLERLAMIAVEDTRRALGRLAADYRKGFVL